MVRAGVRADSILKSLLCGPGTHRVGKGAATLSRERRSREGSAGEEAVLPEAKGSHD